MKLKQLILLVLLGAFSITACSNLEGRLGKNLNLLERIYTVTLEEIPKVDTRAQYKELMYHTEYELQDFKGEALSLEYDSYTKGALDYKYQMRGGGEALKSISVLQTKLNSAVLEKAIALSYGNETLKNEILLEVNPPWIPQKSETYTKIFYAHRDGFLLGLWHGLRSPVVLLVSFFNKTWIVYSPFNKGFVYLLGFILGLLIVISILYIVKSSNSTDATSGE